MDYFYVSSRKVGHALSTKELQKRLREMGKSDKGQRGALMRRYEMYADLEDQDEAQAGVEQEGAGSRQAPHAAERPMMVMVDESTGNKYMRAVDHKGIGPDGDSSWLVKDMHQELKSWGHPGGPRTLLSSRAMVNRPSWPCARPWRDLGRAGAPDGGPPRLPPQVFSTSDNSLPFEQQGSEPF